MVSGVRCVTNWFFWAYLFAVLWLLLDFLQVGSLVAGAEHTKQILNLVQRICSSYSQNKGKFFVHAAGFSSFSWQVVCGTGNLMIRLLRAGTLQVPSLIQYWATWRHTWTPFKTEQVRGPNNFIQL